jgi:glycosyltransferase involved in cell wall biosynthesis
MSPVGLRLSLVLPAFDEAENIGRLLAEAAEVLPRLTKEHEIIVVDDGSRDDTAAIAARFPEVRLLRHERNRGYGAALHTGLRAARLEWVFFTDADLQFDLRDLAGLIEASDGGADIVAGYRAARRDPLFRRALGWVWGRLVRALYGVQVRDVDCAFKLIRRRVLDAIPIESVGAFVNTEILVRARAAGFGIREVPVRHYPRTAGRASGARPRVILRALRELVVLRRKLPQPPARPYIRS